MTRRRVPASGPGRGVTGEATGTWAAGRLAAAIWIVLVLTPVCAAVPGQAGSDSGREILEGAIRLLQSGDALEALMQVERVLARDPDLWEAHLWQGRSLQALGDDLGARDAFLRAARTAPGTGEAHFLAAAASLRIADFDVAWEQAILAAQAGHRESMERLLDSLHELSDPPDDLKERLRAPRVAVEAASGVDPATARTVRQAVAGAPFLALGPGPSEQRLELGREGAELLVRLVGATDRVILERVLPLPGSLDDPVLTQVIREIEDLLRGEERRRP